MSRIFKRVEDFVKFFNNIDVPIVATSGGFDPLHVGHLRCIEETCNIAKSIDGVSVVIVNGDGFLERKKGKPFMKHDERMEIIAGLASVEFVVGWDDGTQTVTECLRMLKPKIFAKGGDRSERSKIPEADVCDEIGCEIRFGVGGTNKVQSSSALIAGTSLDPDQYDLLFRNEDEIKKVREARKTEKPWGDEELLICTDKYAAKIITILRDCRLSRQYHQVKDETIYVLDGTLKLEIGEGNDKETIFMMRGDCKHIRPFTIHRFCAWHGNVRLFEVSTPDLTDVVRLEDDYGREK